MLRMKLFAIFVILAPGLAMSEEHFSHGQCHLQVQPWRMLQWGDPVVQKFVAELDEAGKKRIRAAMNTEDGKGSDQLRWLQNRIMLTSKDRGGALSPTVEGGVSWWHSERQKIASLGRIACYGNLSQARAVAEKTGQPLMIISTELPGCGACVSHGQRQLSHPFVVDAAMEFVPVAVPGGWPKLMFRNLEGEELAQQANHKTSVADTLASMRDALVAAKRPVPDWLELVVTEHAALDRETATFGMGCFWEGEAKLGRIPGVLATKCGSRGGEVVELQFDPNVVSFERLLDEARSFKCASRVIARNDAQFTAAREVMEEEKVVRSDDPIRVSERGTKHRFRKNKEYGLLPLTELQATRLNSSGKNAEDILSPTQLAVLQELREAVKESDSWGDELSSDYSSLDAVQAQAIELRERLEKLQQN